MNTLKKTIVALLVVSLAALSACSDDNKDNNSKNPKDNDVSTLADTDTTDDKDVKETDKDVKETDKDVKETDKDVDETKKDVDETKKDVEDNEEEIEIDGALVLKDLTAEQVNVICAFRFDQFEPNYDPSTEPGKGNCFDEGITEAYEVSSNSQKPAACQSTMDVCMAKEYNRDDINIDNCLNPDIRASCEITVDEYKTCARDLAAASLAHSIALLAKTCDDLSTTRGQNAVEDILASFDYPESCIKMDEDCEYMQLHQN